MANCSNSSQAESARALLKNQQVYFDFARASADATRQLIDMTSPERVVFGSGAPLHSVAEMVSQLNGINGSREVRNKIGNANAASLLTPLRKTSATVLGNRGNAIVSTQ